MKKSIIKWKIYKNFMRINKKIGTLLLLWPNLWALWLSAKGVPPISILFVFLLCVFLMRTAGCIINDYADRNFDGHVKRTKYRPFPSKNMNKKEAKILFLFLLFFSFFLVFTMNYRTIFLSLVGLVLSLIYPFMKRVMNIPQIILGIAFSCGIPISYSTISKSLPISCWLLLLANICWTVSYDTLYSMMDKIDDIKIGIKSSSIIFGSYSKLIIFLLQCSMIIFLFCLIKLEKLGIFFQFSLLLVWILFIYQQKKISERVYDAYLKAFMNNNYVGLFIFLGIILCFL